MPKQILIVDDEETLVWSLAKSLSRDREIYDVTTAKDGESALELLRSSTFDLVVLDIRLPGINGLDVLLQIKEKRPATKVIIMTAYGSRETKERAKARGSLFYIEKPFEIDKIRELILKALKEDPNKGFKGSMSGLLLPDLIQMNCLSQVTTALYITRADREAVIYFEDGQITHAHVGSLDGEDALFTILSWQNGDFRFVGAEKAPRQTIQSNWEYLMVEGTRKADEMSVDLEKGVIDDTDLAPIDQRSRMLMKNLSSLNECTGIALISPEGEILHQHGNISNNLDLDYLSRFFMNLTESLGDIIPSTPQKVSFIRQDHLVLIYPFKIYILILEFNRSTLSQERISSIEGFISRH